MAKSKLFSKFSNSELQIYGNLEKKNRIKYNERSLKIHKSFYSITSIYRNKYIFSTLKLHLSIDIQYYKYHISKHLMSCLSSSFGRRYLNNRYNSVSELLIVVPDRNVAPKSLPVLS